ncbi:lamin tail domain-containing protein [Halocatena pleomorpha]|uniref:lamin tail domain-containing protein n=1 Tax=Halocatena pleomorpha TaxID=1785090 RepID=UPI001F44DE0B|nr:lamin tail domain-containing protein [Halocatena pleomorpha]
MNDEYVTFENGGEQTLNLGDEITLHTGSGSNSATDLYWGSLSAIWNNGGDTVTIEDDAGTVVASQSY